MRRGIAAVAAIDFGRARGETAGRRPRVGTKEASCRNRSVSPYKDGCSARSLLSALQPPACMAIRINSSQQCMAIKQQLLRDIYVVAMVSNEVRLKLAEKRKRRSLRHEREDKSEPSATDSSISGYSSRETQSSRRPEYTRPSSSKTTDDNAVTVASSTQGTASSFTFAPSGWVQGNERKKDDAKYVCEDTQTLRAFWLLLETSMKAKATCMGEETAKRHGSAELEDTMLKLQLTDSIRRTPGTQAIWVIHRQLDNSF